MDVRIYQLKLFRCSESIIASSKIIFEQSPKEGKFSKIWIKQMWFLVHKKRQMLSETLSSHQLTFYSWQSFRKVNL